MVSALMSGCFAEGAAAPKGVHPSTGAVGDPGAVKAAAGARSAPAGGAWTRVEMDVPPKGSLVGFGLSPPILADPEFQGFSEFALELAPIVAHDDAAHVRLWGLLVFHEVDGSAVFEGGVIETAVNVRSRLPLPSSDDIPVSLDPTFYSMFAPSKEFAGTWKFVAVAQADAPVHFALGIRPVDHVLEFGEESAKDTEAFLAARTSAPRPVRTLGEGEGVALAAYADVSFDAAFSWEERVGSVQVVENAPTGRMVPVARDTSVSADHPAESGWSQTLGFYLTASGAASWSASFDVRGEKDSGHSVTFGDPEGSASVAGWFAFGLPAYYGMMDGRGGSNTAFRVVGADAGYFNALLFEQLDLDVPLLDLIGTTTKPSHGVATGLVGDVLPWTVTVTQDGFAALPDGHNGLRIGFGPRT